MKQDLHNLSPITLLPKDDLRPVPHLPVPSLPGGASLWPEHATDLLCALDLRKQQIVSLLGYANLEDRAEWEARLARAIDLHSLIIRAKRIEIDRPDPPVVASDGLDDAQHELGCTIASRLTVTEDDERNRIIEPCKVLIGLERDAVLFERLTNKKSGFNYDVPFEARLLYVTEHPDGNRYVTYEVEQVGVMGKGDVREADEVLEQHRGETP